MLTPTEILATGQGLAALDRVCLQSLGMREASAKRMLAFLRLPLAQLDRLAKGDVRNPYDRIAIKECAALKRELGLA